MDSPIKVWWDLETNPLPQEVEPEALLANITQSFRDLGYLGDVHINAFGRGRDFETHPTLIHRLRENHVDCEKSKGRKPRTSEKIMSVRSYESVWESVHHLHDQPIMLFITTDLEFILLLEIYIEQNVTIMVAIQDENAQQPLRALANRTWIWGNLATGGPALPDVA